MDLTVADVSSDSIYFGSENALAASLFSTLERRSLDSWSPLILYGDSGCGKSFIAAELARRWPSVDALRGPVLTTAADLARLFQPAQLAVEVESVRRKCQSAPLLIVDDVDHLSDRKLACSWLGPILDRRLAKSLPSIVTTKSIAALGQLPSRLFSRLSAGLPVRCVLPGVDTRRTIIRAVLKSSASDATVQSMVERTSGLSVRGILNLALAHSAANSDSLGDSYVLSNALPNLEAGSLADSTTTGSSTDQIHDPVQDFPRLCLLAVSRRFGIRMADVKGTSRRKNTVLARSIAMFLIREFTSLSLTETGQLFQNRDHSTVRHACQKIKKQLLHDPTMQDAVRSICTLLNVTYRFHWSVSTDSMCA